MYINSLAGSEARSHKDRRKNIDEVEPQTIGNSTISDTVDEHQEQLLVNAEVSHITENDSQKDMKSFQCPIKTNATSINLEPINQSINPPVKSTSTSGASVTTKPFDCNSGRSNTHEKTKINHPNKESNLPKEKIKSSGECLYSSQKVSTNSLQSSTNTGQVLIERHHKNKSKLDVTNNRFLI